MQTYDEFGLEGLDLDSFDHRVRRGDWMIREDLGRRRRGGFAGALRLVGTLLSHVIGGKNDEGRKRHRQQRDGRKPMQLRNAIIHIAIQKSEANENKKYVSAKHPERRFAQREERLNGNHPRQLLAQPVADGDESSQIDDAKRADLPFVEQHAKGLLGEVRSQPTVANPDKEEADRCRSADRPARYPLEWHGLHRRPRAKPEAEDPDGLPGEKVEGARLLKWNL